MRGFLRSRVPYLVGVLAISGAAAAQTATPTTSPKPSPSATVTPKPSASPTASATPKASASASPTPSATPKASPSPSASATPKATPSASPAVSATPTPTPKPKATLKATASATPVATATPISTATPIAAATAEPTPEAMPTPEAGSATLGGGSVGSPTSPHMSGWLTTRYDNAAKGPPSAASGTRKSIDAFSVQYARLTFAGSVDPKLSYVVSADFAGAFISGGFVGNTIPFVRDAYIDYDLVKYAQVSVGQMQKPLGLEGRTLERDLPTIDRSLATRLLDAGGNRDIGISVTGKPFDALPLEYAIGAFNGAASNAKDDNPDKDVAARLGFAFPDMHFKFGFSGASGKATATEEDEDLFFPQTFSPGLTNHYDYWRGAYDLDAAFGGFFIQSEGVYGKTRVFSGLLGTPTPTFGSAAIYVLAGYRLAGPTGEAAPFIRYSYLDRTIDQKMFADPHDWRNETTLGMNVECIKKVAILRLQYSIYSGWYAIPTAVDPATGAALRTDKLEGAFAASFQVNFGAK